MEKNKICFGENCFEVEIARTLFEKTKGLRGRNNLEKNKGMLFVFDFQSIYPFSMRRTLIPLDIIWLDKNYQIVEIKENNKPCNSFWCAPLISKKLAKYVLEINAGEVAKYTLKIGDKGKL